jgi:hypothetical protein
MAELKTREHDGDVAHFIRSHADTEQKLDDSFALLELMREATGYEPKMWGDSIIGFGKYHYKSERSRQEGDWMLVGSRHERPPSPFMSMQVLRNRSSCLPDWVSSKWVRGASM